MRAAAILIATIATVWHVEAADTYIEKMPPKRPCLLSGDRSASDPKGKENAEKNRWHAPRNSDFDTRITTQALTQRGNDRDRWNSTKAARLTGYVAVVKDGTKGESCNCGATGKSDIDTHIAVVANARDADDKRKYVIVEVTPRMREILAAQKPAVDWSTVTLKKLLLHRTVQFQGWIFFDSDHVNQATNTHPTDPKRNNWRATCWEIHPVTGFAIKANAPQLRAAAPARKKRPP